MSENNDIENLFKSFDGLETEVPDAVKFKIDKALFPAAKAPWYRINLLLILLIAGVSIFGLGIYYFANQPNELLAQNEIKKQTKAVNQELKSAKKGKLKENSKNQQIAKNQQNSESQEIENHASSKENVENQSENNINNLQPASKPDSKPASILDQKINKENQVENSSGKEIKSLNRKNSTENSTEKSIENSPKGIAKVSNKIKVKDSKQINKSDVKNNSEALAKNKSSNKSSNKPAIPNQNESKKIKAEEIRKATDTDRLALLEEAKIQEEIRTQKIAKEIQEAKDKNQQSAKDLVEKNRILKLEQEKVAMQNSTRIADSLNTASQTAIAQNKTLAPLIPNPKTMKSENQISLFTGVFRGLNNFKSDDATLSITEKSGFYASLEFNYMLNRKIGIASGFDYQRTVESFKSESNEIDSTVIGNTTEYFIDSNQTIIDSIVTPIYGPTTTIKSNSNSYFTQGIGIPVYFSLQFFQKNNWSIGVNSGVRLSYQWIKSTNQFALPSNLKTNAFGVRLAVRPQINYRFKHFGLGTYLNFNYDFKTAANWINSTRKRTEIGGGIVLSFYLSRKN